VSITDRDGEEIPGQVVAEGIPIEGGEDAIAVPHDETRRHRHRPQAGPQEGIQDLQVERPDIPLDLRDRRQLVWALVSVREAVLRCEDMAVGPGSMHDDSVRAGARGDLPREPGEVRSAKRAVLRFHRNHGAAELHDEHGGRAELGAG